MAVAGNKTVSAISSSAISSLVALVSFPPGHERMAGAPLGSEAQLLHAMVMVIHLEGARHLFVADRPAWKSQKKKLLSAAASKANNRMLALAPSAPGA